MPDVVKSGAPCESGDDANREVHAVVVTYHPEERLEDVLRALAGQVGRVWVIDNGSPRTYDTLFARLADIPAVRVIRYAENRGIAAAINDGAHRAHASGARRMVTFDQDSVVPSQFVETLSCIPSEFEAGRVAMWVPEVVHAGTGDPYRIDKAAREGTRPVRFAITSGALVDLDVFEQLGGMWEDLFIDFVDFDYCIRLRQAGFSILQSSDARLPHEIGRQSRHRVGPLNIVTTNHAAVRRYYKHRNFLLLARRYWRTERPWLIRSLVGLLLDPLKIVFFERQKHQKVSAILRGWMDGLRGRVGKVRGG